MKWKNMDLFIFGETENIIVITLDHIGEEKMMDTFVPQIGCEMHIKEDQMISKEEY
jgi:hypothetical protein